MFRLIVISVSFLLAACASSELKTKSAALADSASAGIAIFQKDLNVIEADSRDDLIGIVAGANAILGLSEGCRNLGSEEYDPLQCYLVEETESEGDIKKTPLNTEYEFRNVRKLSVELLAYTLALKELASDPGEDLKKLDKGVTEVGASLAGLVKAITDGEFNKDSEIASIARMVGGISKFALARSRDQKLKEVIVAAEPTVRQATNDLAKAELIIRNNKLLPEKIALQSLAAQTGPAANPSVDARKKNISKLLSGFEDFSRKSAQALFFESLGSAHSELAKLAAGGGSAEDLGKALLEFLSLAEEIKKEATALNTSNE